MVDVVVVVPLLIAVPVWPLPPLVPVPVALLLLLAGLLLDAADDEVAGAGCTLSWTCSRLRGEGATQRLTVTHADCTA